MSRNRCAIYTRKSSEEGLEQDFNSLDAQYDACAAYIKSQASGGWKQVTKRYDDGGLSGGTLQRPALQELLNDIRNGQIDNVVVYKVDRLTRSLLDFSKLVEAFDKAGVSFVSVTQSFNTTTSMGRLTLNMLLSFAQFEREVTAERIRDKIAASKAKGMWMGGTPPLGYQPNGRSLSIVDEDAEHIRAIFNRYLGIGNVRMLEHELRKGSFVRPMRSTSSGKHFGGTPFTRGELYRLLGNPIYVGDIRHGKKVYPGLHPAIIERELFEQAQRLLASHVKGERGPAAPKQKCLLAGLVVDDQGEPLVAAHACKGKRRYRYYVSRSLQEAKAKVGLRVPANELEPLVIETMTKQFERPLEQLQVTDITHAEYVSMTQLSEEVAGVLRDRSTATRRLLRELINKIVIHGDGIELQLRRRAIERALGIERSSDAEELLSITLPARLARTGQVVRLIDGGKAVVGKGPDKVLVKLIARGRGWWQRLISEPGLTVSAIATDEKLTRSYVTRVVRLAFLSPDVLSAIIEGEQPVALNSDAITLPDVIALDWREQRQSLFG